MTYDTKDLTDSNWKDARYILSALLVFKKIQGALKFFAFPFLSRLDFYPVGLTN